MTRGAAVSAQTSIGAQARIIGVLTAASRVAGFVRMLVFAACVGASAVGAAYQSANTIPNVVFEVAAGGILAAVVVPLLARPLERGERQDADRITAALLDATGAPFTPKSAIDEYRCGVDEPMPGRSMPTIRSPCSWAPGCCGYSRPRSCSMGSESSSRAS